MSAERRGRLWEWARRYLPAELAGTACALGAGLGAHGLGVGAAGVAVAATWGENVGFYGYAAVRELRRHAAADPGRRVRAALRATRDLVVEFGPAEALDSLLVRPLLLYLVPRALGSLALGLLVGKLLADVVFYALAVVGYELRKRHLPEGAVP